MDDGSSPRNAKPTRVNSAVSGAEFAGIGIQFALTILVFVFGGLWLDRRLDSSPWFTLIGVTVGAAGGFYSMYVKIMAAQRREAEERRQRRERNQNAGREI